ncbi:Peptidase A1 [Corchorus olitorius]|uniref:Peptidase A1 n=1 Tax=Corchorus olitorius TaxID=93759 RepID=A0A1R3HKY2_9ROSI|nr:Peptidase A1 [Corchorus olitorius]
MADENEYHSVFFIATLISFYFLSTLSSTGAQNGGFSIELIHRDSPKSPFYNRFETTSQRTINALRRSIARANRFTRILISKNEAQSEIIPDETEHLLSISIGTPPFEILAIADTGSDLIWTQCKPCLKCYKQDAPIFNPNSSSTYKTLSCSSRQCQAISGTSCSTKANDGCLYSISYGDGSLSKGDIAIDTITLGSTTDRPVTFPNSIIGCGHDNEGAFGKRGSGIIGLGNGNLSLISQMGSSIAGKFSYCLVPSLEAGRSKMNFGTNAIVQGPGVVSTPLVTKTSDVFYHLTLEAISVDGDKLELTGSSLGTTEGNIIIDSGTTLTILPQDFYSKLEALVASKIDAKRVDAPGVDILSLCYEAQPDFLVPNITMHFTNADVKLSPLNTFILASEDLSCFSFGTYLNFAIYGNLAQMNFLVGYDIENQVVSFKPTDCAKE